MTCPRLKRKFEEVEQAVHSCVETLTGYEKCLLQNKLLVARSRMVNYENLTVMYEAQVSMAKLEVEIATSDIDLLLQELQRGKRFKTSEAITTTSTSTQTNSQSTFSSPTKSVYDTSGISLELPSVALQSFTRQRSVNGPEPSTSHGENAQESTTSQAENAQDSTASQCSKDSGYNWSAKCLCSQEIQVDLSSVNTREGDTEIVKNTKKCKPKKASDTKNKPETSKKITNEQLKSTKHKIKTKDKVTNEKPEVNDELPNISETTQNVDNTGGESVQRRQSQDNRHRKRDEKKSNSHDRRNSAESQNTTTDRCDSLKNVRKHQERKSPKEKCETFDEKQIPNRNNEAIKRKTRHISRSQNIRPRANNRKSSDDDKSYKIHEDIRHKEGKKKSEPAKKSNFNRRENTDPRIKKNEPLKDKNDSDKVKYESKKSEDISCATTLLIPSIVEVETTLPKRRIKNFKPFEIPHDSPIHYTDFENTILSSVADASNITVDGLNSPNTIAQSTPFVRRIKNVEHSGSKCQDLPPNVPCSDPLVEDKLTIFIRTKLADYNKDVTKSDTLTDKDTNDNYTIRDKTTKINAEDTCKNTANDENTKVNDKTTKINKNNACRSERKPKTPEKMIKSTPKQNLMVKIPVTRVPEAISHINPTVAKIPVTREPETMNRITTTAKQPCLTVTVNDAGVITIRPRSMENSNLPSPIQEKTVVETHGQNTQDISIHSTTASDSNEPIIRADKHILKSQDGPTSKTPVKHLEMPTETALYMAHVKDQYYFDIDSPRVADVAPSHKDAVSLFRAISHLMPPSPTFTVSSSSDKENCKSTIPLPPKLQKLPINKNLLDDFLPDTFHSNRNCFTTGFKNDIHTSHRNDIHISHSNDINTNHRNDINTCYKNDVNTSHRNYINSSQRNYINSSQRNDINTSHRNNNIVNNIYNNTKHMPVRRASVADIIPRRTIQFTDAKPLPARKTKTTPKPKTNRRKSLDDRAILRILNDPCSSVSSKSASPKSKDPTPKKKDVNISSDRLLYGLYKDIQTASCRNFAINKAKHNCLYCGPVNEGHMCFFSLKKLLEQC